MFRNNVLHISEAFEKVLFVWYLHQQKAQGFKVHESLDIERARNECIQTQTCRFIVVLKIIRASRGLFPFDTAKFLDIGK